MLAPVLLLAIGCFQSVDAPPDHVEYVVVKGDTLFVIAKQHGVTVDDLMAWNGLKSDRIEIGQVLTIKTTGEVAAVAPPPRKPKKKLGGATLTGEVIEGGHDAPKLTMPERQACLPPPDVTADEGMASSAGLSIEQLRESMGGFVAHTLPCFDGVTGDTTVDLSITVGCDGRVLRVETLDSGSLPDSATNCVEQTLTYAPFPAHDIPDGFTFEYPLRFEAP